MLQSRAGERPQTLRIWPWSTRVAVLLIPVILLSLVILHSILQSVLQWPDPRLGGWVLLGIVVLSVIPVLLVLIEMLASAGGSVTVAGVALSFTGESMLRAAGAVRSISLAENLDLSIGSPVSRSSVRSIGRALRRAHDNEVVVVDLKAGQTWWETRLFILIAGAARTGRPLAVAFVADRNGNSRALVGWATSADLLEMHSARNPRYAAAREEAARQGALWRLGTPAPPTPNQPPSVILPWHEPLQLPAVDGDPPDLAFVDELFLQQQLENPELQGLRHVTIQRLMELYEPVLITDHVDTDARTDAWLASVQKSRRGFIAVTDAGDFKGLVSRDAVISAVLAQVASAVESRPTSRT